MDAWAVWLIISCILAVGEILTLGFFLAPFAGGAAIAAAVSALGGGTAVSMAVFLGVSISLFVFVRPVVRSHRRMPAQLRTGTAALIGRSALVVEQVGAGSGCVKIGGEIWSARPFDDDQVFEPGSQVEVMEIRGATAVVG